MVNIMRSNQRWLMIVISVLVLISMIWVFNNGSRMEHSSNDGKIGTIYGRSLSLAEFQRVDRQLRTANDLRLTNITAPELAQGQDENEMIKNLLVVQHQADALGIFPSDAEVADAEKKLTVFQSAGGAFDPAKYADFVDTKLTPRGFSEVQLEELVRLDLQIGKLRQLIDAPVLVSPSEVRAVYAQLYDKTAVSVIKFTAAEFAAGTDPSDDDIKKSFEANKAKYEKPESRKVMYVRFGLDEAQAKLTGKERAAALKPLGDQAEAFLQGLIDKKTKADFEQAAQAAKVAVKESPLFEAAPTAPMPESAIQGFTQAAYQLTPKNPISDVPLGAPTRVPDAYYVQFLSEVVPVRPLTFEEARPKVVAELKDERAHAALTAKAEEIRTKITDAMKKGKSFADAASEAGKPAQEEAPFALLDRTAQGAQPDEHAIQAAATELAVGDVSKFVPTDEGGMLVYVRTRFGTDQAEFQKKETDLSTGIRESKARGVFEQWLEMSKEEANAQFNVQMRG